MSAAPISFTAHCCTSRFMVAYLGMLTCEHEAIDISKLINSGLLGLSRSVTKLAGTELLTEDVCCDTIETENMPNLQLNIYQDQEGRAKGMRRFQAGTVVVRGPDWNYGNQDGPPPSRGIVVSELSRDYWVRVRWNLGSVNSYRIVKYGKYDLAVAPEGKLSSGRVGKGDSPVDTELLTDVEIPYHVEGMASSLILQSSVCLLRSMSVACSVHSNQLPHQTSYLLSSLLLHLKKQSE